MGVKLKILVTGATGFVGRAVVEELQKFDDYEIYGLSRKSLEFGIDESKNIKQILTCDISDYETLKEVERIGKIDIVIQCAGLAHQFGEIKAEEFYRINVLGTENICQLAANLGAKKLVHLSSVAVYGDYGEVEIDETFECRPAGVYAESKLSAEFAAREFCRNNNILLTILRLVTVIGENDRGNTMRLITSIDKGNFFWIGNGRNLKSLIYKKDVACAILKVVNSSGSNHTEIYNLCGESVSMKAVVETISDVLGKSEARLKIPESLIHPVFALNKRTFNLKIFSKYSKIIEKWLADDIFSGKKFNKEYHFQIKTPVVEAIRLQVNNHLEKKNNFKCL